MKRITSFLVCLLLYGFTALYAQDVQIKGKVTSAEDGEALPGVSVIIKGTQTGTATDANGNFVLTVPADATLVISSVGFKTQEVAVAGRTVVDVAMEAEVVAVDEVVVTALGIKREKKRLGYSVQEVNGEQITQARSSNVINALSGKVAGVSVTSASGNMGGSTRVLIRGAKSIGNNNQPLYLVDGVPIDNSSFNTLNTQRGAGGYDYGSMAADINPDDVESITVLKGPSASALYGSRAANGVIMITTKKGSQAKKGLGVEINSAVEWEKIAVLPKYQNLYGGGYGGDGPDGFDTVTINGVLYNLVTYALDESWGPKYNPNIRVLASHNIFDWEAKGKVGNPETTPWVAPENDVETFFETGTAFTNNIALFGANENSSFRLSYTNYSLDGYMPNSKLNRHSVSFNGDSKISRIIKAFTSLNYLNTEATGRAATGYDDNNVMQKFNQWGQRQLDMKIMRNYVNPDGTQRVWNRNSWDDPTPAYSDNPYWTRFKNYQNDIRNRVYGNIGASINPLPWITLQGKIYLDYYNLREMERVAIGSQAEPSYYEGLRENVEVNSELLATANKAITDKIDLIVNAGVNFRNNKYNSNLGQSKGGLVIPELYVLTNSVFKPDVTDYQRQKKINSVFGSVSLGFADMVFLDATLRNDWSSSLSKETRSYMYPSLTGSFVFSELKFLEDQDILSYGKIRVGWAQTGNDTDPYNTDKYYNYIENFGEQALYSLPNTLYNPDLKSELTSSYEVGTDLRFLKDRVGIDFTYYNEKTENQILSVAISGASGYGFKLINAGKITNKGIELTLNVTPVKFNGFQWNILLNYSKNKNEVVELAPDVDVYQLANGPFNISVNAEVKKPYGSLIGSNYVKDSKGNKIVDLDGYYLNGNVESLGSVMPDYLAGIWNTFTYKGIEVAALIDVRKGGYLFSTTSMWGRYSGILEETAATNANGKNVRDPVEEGGGVLVEGVYGEVNADGSIQYLDANGNPSDVPVKNQTYIDAESWGAWHYDGPAAQNIFKADYWKLREVRISYTIPSRFTGPVQKVKLSAYGRNLAMWGTDIKHIDPENTTSSGNIQGIEGGALPSLKYYGISLNLIF